MNILEHELATKRRVLAAFESTEGDWLKKMRAALRTLYFERSKYPEQATVSADDARKLMEKHPEMALPEDTSMNVMGALFMTDEWMVVGTKKSETEGRRGSRIMTWKWWGPNG